MKRASAAEQLRIGESAESRCRGCDSAQASFNLLPLGQRYGVPRCYACQARDERAGIKEFGGG